MFMYVIPNIFKELMKMQGLYQNFKGYEGYLCISLLPVFKVCAEICSMKPDNFRLSLLSIIQVHYYIILSCIYSSCIQKTIFNIMFNVQLADKSRIIRQNISKSYTNSNIKLTIENLHCFLYGQPYGLSILYLNCMAI